MDRPEQARPSAPAPTTGHTGSTGQPIEGPTVGHQPQVGEHAPDTPGFHAPTRDELERPQDGHFPVSPASLQLDNDAGDRADTGTGDQPSNMGGSRTGTPPEPVRKP